MPWVWNNLTNPAADAIIVQINCRGGEPVKPSLAVYGVYVAQNSTAVKRYVVQRGSDALGWKTVFTICVPAGNSFTLVTPDEPLVSQVGFVGMEGVRIVTIDGGEPAVSAGLMFRGGVQIVIGKLG